MRQSQFPFLLVVSTACVDQPVCLTPAGGTEPAEHLSQLGLFEGELKDLEPTEGVVPYTVNASLYADHATKHRFIMLPEGEQIRVSDDWWELPVGTLLVKVFAIPYDLRAPEDGERILETRLLVKTEDGLTASTYVWDEDERDAACSGGNVQVPVRWTDQDGARQESFFQVPGTSQCESCHGERALGLRTRQMNVPNGQMEEIYALGVIDALPAEPWEQLLDPLGEGELEPRARSYLDANCGHCHSPEGTVADLGLDFRYENEDPRTLGIGVPAQPVDGAWAKIAGGDPDGSTVITRMRSSNPYLRMPRGTVHIPDTAGIELLSDWIRALEEE